MKKLFVVIFTNGTRINIEAKNGNEAMNSACKKLKMSIEDISSCYEI